MRISSWKSILGPTLLLSGASSTLASQARVELVTSESHTVWYADPFWIGVGAVALVVIFVLAIMASRREPKTTTTVIR
jgi:formate-dependent nitrite reductase membrane component NrfD